MPDRVQNDLNDFHECDLFVLSSHHPWLAHRSLDSFARLGSRNVHGWGIGSYRDGKANVVKSELAAFDSNEVSREFKMAMKAVCSEIIIGHLRLTSSGGTRIENNHPFKLSFLGYDWLMIHNGTGYTIHQLVHESQRLLRDSTNDTARAFEYLRTGIIQYYTADPKHSLIEAVRNAYTQLLSDDPMGKYNIILSNGYLTWCFVHWRSFYMLRREKTPGDVCIVSTIKLNENEEWYTFDPRPDKQARMLVYCGNSLIMNGNVPR